MARHGGRRRTGASVTRLERGGSYRALQRHIDQLERVDEQVVLALDEVERPDRLERPMDQDEFTKAELQLDCLVVAHRPRRFRPYRRRREKPQARTGRRIRCATLEGFDAAHAAGAGASVKAGRLVPCTSSALCFADASSSSCVTAHSYSTISGSVSCHPSGVSVYSTRTGMSA